MLISIKIPIQAHRATGVMRGWCRILWKKKDETVARKQRQLSNKIEKFMNEVNSENFFGAVALFFKIPQILFQNISKNVLNINKLGCFLIVPKIIRCNLQYS